MSDPCSARWSPTWVESSIGRLTDAARLLHDAADAAPDAVRAAELRLLACKTFSLAAEVNVIAEKVRAP
jgi:hypothetical protein